jgi:hypothetical protein
VSAIVIEITEPGGSPVDYTDACIFESCNFAGLMGGVAGRFSIKVRDPDRSLSFVTGSEISLSIDGVLMFGGYITVIEMNSLAPAADTSDLATYDLRTWTLSGPDYNIIFDRRFWRNTADYLKLIDLTAFTTDGAILREAVDNYADVSDFSSTGIEDIATFASGDQLAQGDPLRKEFENLSQFGGAVWYIAPDKTFIYKPYDNVLKRWGFSDVPNETPITVSPDEYQGATYPFREVTGTEDASFMVNDALIWGGSKFAGAGGGTVFSRSQDATSISDHHRWQTAEIHFGEQHFLLQAGVDARADVIINGPPGADITGQQKGLKYPQWQFNFTWISSNVPLLSGVPDHIRPGDIVNIDLEVFDVEQLLPVRELRISFPDAFEEDGTHLVQFDATFGLQLSDPYSLWRYLLTAKTKLQTSVNVPSVVSDSSSGTSYGAQYTGVPTPATDNSTTVFAMPFGFVSGSVALYLNGLIQRLGVDFTESDSEAGEITLSSPPLSTDNLYMTALTLEA